MKMDANDGLRDLAPLSPRADPARWEAMVASIEDAAAPELARRAAVAGVSLVALLSGWSRSAVPAAVGVAIAAMALLVLGRAPDGESTPGVSDALGFPEPVAAWVEVNQEPTLEEMVLLLEGEGYDR